MHYDTVDNFHVVVGDASKSFDVISPGYAIVATNPNGRGPTTAES